MLLIVGSEKSLGIVDNSGLTNTMGGTSGLDIDTSEHSICNCDHNPSVSLLSTMSRPLVPPIVLVSPPLSTPPRLFLSPCINKTKTTSTICSPGGVLTAVHSIAQHPCSLLPTMPRLLVAYFLCGVPTLLTPP
jgi:hypothetical protein